MGWRSYRGWMGGMGSWKQGIKTGETYLGGLSYLEMRQVYRWTVNGTVQDVSGQKWKMKGKKGEKRTFCFIVGNCSRLEIHGYTPCCTVKGISHQCLTGYKIPKSTAYPTSDNQYQRRLWEYSAQTD